MRVWEGSMRWQGRAATASGITSSFLTIALPAAALWMSLTAGSSHAADLVWDVENPFRFFKPTRSFALHETAFNAVRGNPSQPLQPDIIWRTERALNDPDCKDASTPDRCAATAGKRYQQSRLGWAAQTLADTCYEISGPRFEVLVHLPVEIKVEFSVSAASKIEGKSGR